MVPKKHRFLIWSSLIALIVLRLPRLDTPLLDAYNFRQTQTALTAYWFSREGVSLPDYPLPVLGYPWSAPFEFPIFQLIVAGVHILGVPMDLAARGCGLLAFAAAVLLMTRLLARIGVSGFATVLFVGMAAVSPFGLIWSRACLIDFTSVLFSLIYVYAAIRTDANGWRPTNVLLMISAGTLAATTKITTFPVFWSCAAAIAFDQTWHLWKRHDVGQMRRLAIRTAGWVVVLALPVLAAFIWTWLADEVKSRSLTTQWLTSDALSGWNIGSSQQRRDLDSWGEIGQRITTLVLPWIWPLILVGLITLFRQSRYVILVTGGMVVGALGTVLLFFNLYVIHEYYLCAVAFPLWLLAALGMDQLARVFQGTLWKAICVIAPLVALGASSTTSAGVHESYRDMRDDDVLAIARAIRQQAPDSAEIVIFGDDWNSRVPYYARRKALMVKDPIVTDSMVLHYIADRKIRFIIGHDYGCSRIRALWPEARVAANTKNYALFVLQDSGR